MEELNTTELKDLNQQTQIEIAALTRVIREGRTVDQNGRNLRNLRAQATKRAAAIAKELRRRGMRSVTG